MLRVRIVEQVVAFSGSQGSKNVEVDEVWKLQSSGRITRPRNKQGDTRDRPQYRAQDDGMRSSFSMTNFPERDHGGHPRSPRSVTLSEAPAHCSANPFKDHRRAGPAESVHGASVLRVPMYDANTPET